MPFPLLDLPPEIREKIYLHTLTSLWPIRLTRDRFSPETLHPLFPHALLLTCHQVYHEVRPLYFAYNSFLLILVRDPSPLMYFISPDFRDNRLRVRSLTLVTSRWGRHDFFLRELAPLLEDMILNGALRELEVWIRWNSLASATKEDWTTLGEKDVVERLMQILGDPYLEKVVLKRYMDRARTPGFPHEGLVLDITDTVYRSVEDVTYLIPFQARDHRLRAAS